MKELPQSKQGKQQKWKQSPLIVKVQPQIVEPGEGQVLGEPVPTQGKAKPPAILEKGQPDLWPGQPRLLMLQPEEQGQCSKPVTKAPEIGLEDQY